MSRLYAEVRFPTLQTGLVPVAVDIYREAFSHEKASFRFAASEMTTARLVDDLPVLISWGKKPAYREVFVGYVLGFETSRAASEGGREQVEVICIGPTRALRDEFSYPWGTTRLDIVADKLSQQYSLEIDTDTSFPPHVGLMQHGQSSWEFLNEIAETDGAHISVSGTRLHVWDLRVKYGASLSVAPTYDRSRQEIFEFDATAGVLLPGHENARDVGFALQNDEMVAYASDFTYGESRRDYLQPSTGFARLSQGVAETKQELTNRIEAAKLTKGRTNHAHAELSPHPPLRPADVVVLLNNSDRHSGPWFVDKVHFHMDQRKLEMDVDLSRRASSDPLVRASVPFGAASHRAPVSARISGNRWVPGGVL